MDRPRLLDLFCGAGGAAMGYHRAGFDVVGVDCKPQPRYPFEFVQADALEVLREWRGQMTFPGPAAFDAIHASPPCQRYMRGGQVRRELAPDLLGAAREGLERAGVPWVIENVPGAPMRADLLLCGSMFGLRVRRHRLFETSPRLLRLAPPHKHDERITGVYGSAHGAKGAWTNGRKPFLPSNRETWSREMGIDWMRCAELTQAIPPAYTEFVGLALLATLVRS